MNINKKWEWFLSLIRLLWINSRLISPISWWHCFSLLYIPISNQGNRFRLSIEFLKYVSLHLIVLILIGLWCYIYWMITFDAGQYFTLLSRISSNRTNLTDGRQTFDQLVWRTALKTLFISIDFGLINTCAVHLSAHWRERLTKQFYQILFRFPNGCILYETGQQSQYDLPSRLTNDIRQMTSNLSIGLFGSLYFSGLIAVSTVIVVFSIYIVNQTNGDTNGIAICFITFAICVLFVLLISRKYNRTTVEQLKSKGKLRSYLQNLQTYAECLAFYRSTKQCELKSFFKLNQRVHHWNTRAAFYYFFVTFPLVIMDVVGSLITYILPAFLFFFLRKSNEQTRDDATKYLSIIAFYGYVFWLLNSLVYINESTLIALNLADQLWKLKQRLIRLHKFHQRRFEDEKVKQIKIETPNSIEFIKLRIVIPDENGERILQSNINLNVHRGQCLLINGATGCGKTSLFRICAGLWPIDAQLIKLPPRKQTIYIPQRPYLPMGSLRFQTLFLLNIRTGWQWNEIINDQQIRELFQFVRMDYLLDRYHLDSIILWSSHLSIGEQQRLAFVRLFALFKYNPKEIENILLMFDESTSAVDTITEGLIYQLLKEFGIWYITISHRLSLIKYHQKELKLYSNIRPSDFINLDLQEQEQTNQADISSLETDQNLNEQNQLSPISINTNLLDYIDTKSSENWLKQMKDLWNLIHLPFESNDLQLRLKTYIGWLMCLIVLGCYTYITYRRTIQTGDIFRVMPNYAASKLDLNEGRKQIVQLIWSYLLHLFGVILFYSIQLSIGQYLASLYTRRQSNYLGRLLLDDDEHQYTLYHTNKFKYLPSIISHDLSDMNVQLFYLLIGSMYFNGIIGVLMKLIPYTLLLAKQSGSLKGVIIVYAYQLFTSSLILSSMIPYYRTNLQYENSFSLLSNAQKRVDNQSEQIALSDQSVIDIEQEELQVKLDQSIEAQKRSGYFYGLLTACSVFGNWSSTIINYAIPSLIFFHLSSNRTSSDATSIITLTLFTEYLQSNLAVLNSHGQPFSQIWTSSRRIRQNLDELIRIREYHRQLRLKEFLSGRRIEMDGKDHSFLLNKVDVCIPSFPSNVLIRSLSFSLNECSSLVITGSSGCGKSSFLRLLAGLEYNLTENSSMEIPYRSSMIFIPQQVYLIEGTLREQLNYFRQSRSMSFIRDDSILEDLLFKFNLSHLVHRYTFDSSIHLWSRTLSLGEQQRLIVVTALLTLFPPIDSNERVKYFILDETTAGCDQFTEKMIYEYFKNEKIRFISISHRQQLIQYHSHQLIIQSNDHSYQFIQLTK